MQRSSFEKGNQRAPILINSWLVIKHMKLTKSVGSRRFTILVQEEPEGGYTGKCLELRGAVSYGKTIEELKANMKDAITLVLDVLEEEAAKKGSYRKEVIEISS